MSDEFYQQLTAAGLSPFWKVISPLQRGAEARRARLWRWEELRPLLMRAGELVGPKDGAERRVLILRQPDNPAATTATLTASLQLVLPGETVPAHRHTMAALRFVIAGDGAYTEIDGQRITMAPGDLVLTPAWSRHGHGNQTADPIVWMDGLDAPLVRTLRADFFQGGDDEAHPGDNGAGGEGGRSLVYRWADAYGRLARQQPADGDLVEEYTDPVTGGPVLPTMACFLRLIRAGRQTPPRRQTGNTIFHVVQGRGRTTIDDEELHWRKGDILAVPSWLWHAHASADNEDAVLFSFTDAPVLRALGLYREETRR